MKSQFVRFVTGFSACILCSINVPGQEAPTKVELDTVLARAAARQPGDDLESFRSLEIWVRQSLSDSKLRRQIETGLCQLLAPDSTLEARRFACEQLGIIGDTAALPKLAELLKNDQSAAIACLGLTTFPRGKADQVLRAALTSSSGAARIQIITTLGDRRDARSVSSLATLASDADQAVAAAAVAALGKIGNARAHKAILQLRQTAGPTLEPAITEATLRCAERLAEGRNRREAAGAYEELTETSQPAYIRRAAFAALLRLEGDRGEERIMTVLRGSDSALKPVAIAAVRDLHNAGASGRFAQVLSSLGSEEQAWLIDSLAARGDGAAREAIARSVDSSDASVRSAAIDALGRIGDDSCAGTLARAAAQAKSKEERRAIEGALISLPGGAKTDAAILSQFDSASGEARATLISSLAERQGAAATSTFLTECENADSVVAIAAFRALGQTAEAGNVSAMLDRLARVKDDAVRSEAESAASQVLGRMKDASQRSDALKEALARAPNAEVRCSILGLLPACGDAASLEELSSAATDRDTGVRAAAIRALAEWPNASAWTPLDRFYEHPESEALRAVALRGLVRLAGEENAHPDAQLIARYRQLLSGAKGDADLRLILGALSSAAHPDALGLVLPLLSNPDVRAESEVAVKKIAASIKAQHPKEAQEALQKLEANP